MQSDLHAIKGIVTEVVDGAFHELAGIVKSTIADKMATKEDLHAVEQKLGGRLDVVEERLTNIEGEVQQTRIDVTTANNRLGNIESAVGDLRATDDGIVDALAAKKLLSESEAHALRHKKPNRNLAHA
ncbi:MAG: hypothetical protein HC882_04930 [Acidobacteria bacterium]|nr:hypothetical protein [Acidobacteriota bacterium]